MEKEGVKFYHVTRNSDIFLDEELEISPVKCMNILNYGIYVKINVVKILIILYNVRKRIHFLINVELPLIRLLRKPLSSYKKGR